MYNKEFIKLLSYNHHHQTIVELIDMVKQEKILEQFQTEQHFGNNLEKRENNWQNKTNKLLVKKEKYKLNLDKQLIKMKDN